MAKFTSRLALLAFSLLPAAVPLRAADAPAPSHAGDTENKLATALRSYELLQHENDQLKATIASQQTELQKLHQRLSAPPAADDTAKELAETKDKLSTALRSYSLLEAENDRLKADADKSASAAEASAAKMSADSAAQLSSLYDQLRQTRAQLAAISAENADLRTRLGLASPPPGDTRPTPSRIASSQPKTQNSEPQTAAAPAPRTHVVATGDTLAAISRQYYGTPDRWPDILRANRDVIKDEAVLPLGVTLRIPQ
jgi:nucleoid-associated protein YgaU